MLNTNGNLLETNVYIIRYLIYFNYLLFKIVYSDTKSEVTLANILLLLVGYDL